ncbi:MAG: hypothetical protein CMP63_08450 [Flavobacteriales bacterium]|nr:hypothetical protein [Flavobacteriales bacterium]|tara:strand:+ start:29144 stop:29872 length:729 start_codon:yes stop_codon:yes gene_type:complete
MRNWLLVLILIFCFADSFAQKQDKHDHTVGYHNIFYSGIQINTNGFGGSVRRGFHKTARKKKLFEMGFNTLKHPREVKMLSSDGGDGFVFAKKNSAFNLRLGKGEHNVIAFKPFGEGIELKTIYAFGINTTFLKPIYYYMAYGDNQTVQLEKFDEDQHNVYNVVKSGSYFKGFKEIALQPGIFGKFALNFEYAVEKSSIRSLEVGAIVDGYYKDVEILAFADNYPIIVSLYLSFQYGKKWYR